MARFTSYQVRCKWSKWVVFQRSYLSTYRDIEEKTVCRDTFYSRPSQAALFCSRACHTAYRRKQVDGRLNDKYKHLEEVKG